MRRSVASLLILTLLAATLTTAVPAAAAQTNVQIQSVDVSPAQPAPDERFTLTVTVANFASSSGSVDVEQVYLREQSRTFARTTDVGSIAAGGTLTVPLTAKFEEAGGKRLSVNVVVEDGDGDERLVKYPLYLTVEEPDEAAISVAGLDPVVGQKGPVDLVVSNGDTKPISNVRLRVAGDARVENPNRVSASIPAGTQRTHTYQVTFPESGPQQLEATLRYKTSGGNTRTVRRTVTTDVEPATNDPELRTTIETESGSSVVRTELQQFGNADLIDVEIRAVQDGDIVARTLMADVPAKGTQTVALDGSTIPGGSVEVVAEFTAAGTRRTVSETLDYKSDVELDVSNQLLNGTSVIRAELQQFGNVELRDVEIRAESGGETVARVPVRNVLSEGTRTVALSGDEIPAGDITVVASYTAGSERKTVSANLLYSKYSPAPTSAISLTSIETSRQGDVLTLNGEAANVGTAQVNSVVVSAVETDTVRPVEPNREYFIQQINSNEFADFEATARVPTDTDQIPIQVQYTVNGQRVSSIIPVDLADGGAQSGDENRSGDGPSAFAVGSVLLLLIIVGVGVYQLRSQ